MNITPNVKSAMEKSGTARRHHPGGSLHSNSGVFINDDEAGPAAGHRRVARPPGAVWRRLSSRRQRRPRGEQRGAHLQSILLNQQAMLSFADGKLEMGPWQQVIYAELDGMRPKRIHIKVLGE